MITTTIFQKLEWPSVAAWQSLPTESSEYGPSLRYIGLDMPSIHSFASAVVLRRKQNGISYAQSYFWLPEDVAKEHSSDEATPFLQWADLGYLRLTPGNVINRELILNQVIELCAELDPVAIAIDRYQSATYIGALNQTGTLVAEVGGSFHMLDEPTRTLADLIASGQLQRQPNPVFDWMYGNVTLKNDPQNRAKINYAPKGQSVSGVNALVLALTASLMGY